MTSSKTICEDKRNFSKLLIKKNIKFCSTMLEDYPSILCIETDLPKLLSYERAIEEYSAKKFRKNIF